MGLLFHARTARVITLEPRSLVGRGRGCAVRIEDRRASAEHALLSWQRDRWEARDLGSLNGTWVDGQRVRPGQRVPLRAEAKLAFGVADDPWVLADGRGLEPATLPSTLKARGGPVDVRTIGLHFVVSLDEEHVDLTLCLEDGVELALPPRSSHYTLLTLARSRLEDASHGAAESEWGWIYACDLAGRLGFTAERLNVEIFRARALLAKAGIADAEHLIERRASSRQLRIGVARLSISRQASRERAP